MGNKQTRMNEQSAANILRYPEWNNTFGDEVDEKRPGWFKRQLVALGVYDMANASTQPLNGNINFQKLSFFLGLVLAILGGFWWSYNLGRTSGIETGRQQEVIDQMRAQQADERDKLQKQIDTLKSELQKKKELELVNSTK